MSTARSNTAGTRDASGRLVRWIGAAVIGLVLLLLVLALMNRKDELPTTYGKRRGANAAESVNGTAVLAAMFEAQGHSVITATELSRRMDNYNTIVWAPDSFDAPSTEARNFLDAWLSQSPNRTLVYIGRDYDAAPEYWQRMLQQVDDPRHDEYQRRYAHAKASYDARRTEMPVQEACGWFTIETNHPHRKIPDLDGSWAAGIDAAKTDIFLACRLDIPEDSELQVSPTTYSSIFNDPYAQSWPMPMTTESDLPPPVIKVLLQSENDILAHSFQQPHWNGSKVIVVANGSFLLNMPLVNKEHRKLAGHLVAECGTPGDVIFLETGPDGVSVNKGNPLKTSSHALDLFNVWPVSFIFIHFAALGIVYCISVFPIFGRPQELRGEARADFGKHVSALGELLQKTKDTFFAESKIQAYHNQSKRGSGQSHRAIVPKAVTKSNSEPAPQAEPTKPTS